MLVGNLGSVSRFDSAVIGEAVNVGARIEALTRRYHVPIITSGETLRPDDNPETLKKRLAVYHANTAPLLDFYRAQGKLRTVDGMAPIPMVSEQVRAILSAIKRR